MSLEKIEARETAAVHQATGAGRTDYNALVSFKQIPPDEPYFILRAKDALAAGAIRAWAALAYDAMAPLAIIEQALQQADALEDFASRRVPDASHLSPEEVLNLAYQFERRCWKARSDSIDPRLMLAEGRGLAAAMGRLRPILSVLFAGLEQQEDGSHVFRMPVDGNGKPQGWPDPIAQLRQLSMSLRGAQPQP